MAPDGDGSDGSDGHDGSHGRDGRDGNDGSDGHDGSDGRDGRDRDEDGAGDASADAGEPAMTRFPVPDHGGLPADLRERIAEETERAGFTPNVFEAYAYKPSHFRAFFAYYDALVEDTPLSRAEVEMLVVATSGANDCLYCVVAHGALARVYSERPKLADQLATNPRSADLSPRHEAMVEFALQLTERPETVGDAEYEALRAAGLEPEEIWDVGSVVAFFNLSNRMATLADMRPNDEFYTMGRGHSSGD